MGIFQVTSDANKKIFDIILDKLPTRLSIRRDFGLYLEGEEVCGLKAFVKTEIGNGNEITLNVLRSKRLYLTT